MSRVPASLEPHNPLTYHNFTGQHLRARAHIFIVWIPVCIKGLGRRESRPNVMLGLNEARTTPLVLPPGIAQTTSVCASRRCSVHWAAPGAMEYVLTKPSPAPRVTVLPPGCTRGAESGLLLFRMAGADSSTCDWGNLRYCSAFRSAACPSE